MAMLRPQKVLILLLLSLVVGASGAFATLDPEMTVSPNTYFPLLGNTMSFTITGPPGATYSLRGAVMPAAVNDPVWGLIFLGPNQKAIETGVLNGAGEAVVSLAIPSDPSREGKLFYFQAFGQDGADRGGSNQVAVRVQSAVPSGAREPQSIAVTPGGEKAYVAHEEDGTISVIDVASDSLLYNIPTSAIPPSIGMPSRVRVDPVGRHVYVINPQFRQVTALHRKTDSIAAQIPVPAASRDIAFDFSGADLVYITNEKENAVLVFEEAPAGNYTQIDTIALEGKGPGPITVLPDGLLMIAHRSSHEVEVVDPNAPVGNRTVARTAIDLPAGLGVPNDLAVVGNSRVLVPTFIQDTNPDEDADGHNQLVEISLTDYSVLSDMILLDEGTDYWDAEVNPDFLAITGTGSGTIVFADPMDFTFEDAVELAPGEPLTVPMELAFVPDAQGGAPQKLYAVNHFRETVRAIDLTQGAPYVLGAEIPLAWSGQPRVPGVDLNQVENGEWFYASIAFFNGTAQNLNPVTCNTCHPNTFTDGLVNKKTRQSQSFHDLGSTGPWLHNGARVSLLEKTGTLFTAHGKAGGTLQPDAEADLTEFQEVGTELTISPFLNADGSMTASAINGEVIFNSAGTQCSSCHMAPLYLPQNMVDRTIEGGIGSGLAPINIPSLRGLWASPPYMHDGTSPTLLDVLQLNLGGAHGDTSSLTQQELDDLVAFLLSI